MYHVTEPMLQVQHAEISIMRASFIFTHQPGRRFHFMEYILASMDDDCAKVCNLLIMFAHNIMQKLILPVAL